MDWTKFLDLTPEEIILIAFIISMVLWLIAVIVSVKKLKFIKKVLGNDKTPSNGDGECKIKRSNDDLDLYD